MEPEVQFWAKVQKTETCWLWTASTDRGGYGSFTFRSPGAGRRSTKAHRYSYELVVGPIPEELEIDHLCRVRACVNPEHLEAVTKLVNIQRAKPRLSHCFRGHPYSGDNLLVLPNGERVCRACAKIRSDKFRAKKRGL